MDIKCTINVSRKDKCIFSKTSRRIDSTDEHGDAFLLRGRIMEDCAELAKKAATAMEKYEVEHEPVAPKWLDKTNRDFWNCECKENYIHHTSQTACKICGMAYMYCKHSTNREIIGYGAAYCTGDNNE